MWHFYKGLKNQRRAIIKSVRGLVTNNQQWKLLFLGTDNFALTHLETLRMLQIKNSNLISKLAVITKKKCPVSSYAEENKIEYHYWPIAKLPECDLGIVVSFGHLIPLSVIQQIEHGIINVHPSLLPRWRGAAPIVHTILSGDKQTGVSLAKIQPHKFDCGPILLQKTVDLLDPHVNTTDLRHQLAQTGAQMLTSAVLNWKALTSIQQCESSITLAPKVNLSHAYINWDNTMEQIDRQYRALGPLFTLRSQFNKQAIRLLDMIPFNDMKLIIPDIETELTECTVLRPGYICYHRAKEILCIKCKDGWVGFSSVLIRKQMTAKAFYNGYLSQKENKHSFFNSLNNGLEKFTYWNDNTGYS